MQSYTNRPDEPQAERPRAEPEIIPPGVPLRSDPRVERTIYTHDGMRIHTVKMGPFGVAMVLLAGAVIGAVGLALLLGAAVIGAAAAGVIVIGAAIARLLRGPVRH